MLPDQNWRMAYHAFRGYEISKHPSYVVVWDLQWEIIESKRIDAGADLQRAMAAAIDQAKATGWQPEAEPAFGFAFIRRGDGRRLLAITQRDPFDQRPQSFNPLR